MYFLYTLVVLFLFLPTNGHLTKSFKSFFMKKILIILLFITNPLQAEKIEQLSWYNLQELLEDDKLTYKIIKSCVSLNSAITELIKEEHPDLANEFFKSANYLYPFGILVLKKIKNLYNKEAE